MVTRDLADVFKMTRTHVKEELAVRLRPLHVFADPSNILQLSDFAKHLVFDGWAAASRRSFMGIGTAFFNGERIVFRHLDLVPYVFLHLLRRMLMVFQPYLPAYIGLPCAQDRQHHRPIRNILSTSGHGRRQP